MVFFAHTSLINPDEHGSSWVSSVNSGSPFDNIKPGKTTSNNAQYYILPIFEYVSSSGTGNSKTTTCKVPQVSKIKFVTSTSGSSRSVSIDDGELT